MPLPSHVQTVAVPNRPCQSYPAGFPGASGGMCPGKKTAGGEGRTAIHNAASSCGDGRIPRQPILPQNSSIKNQESKFTNFLFFESTLIDPERIQVHVPEHAQLSHPRQGPCFPPRGSHRFALRECRRDEAALQSIKFHRQSIFHPPLRLSPGLAPSNRRHRHGNRLDLPPIQPDHPRHPFPAVPKLL